MANLQQQIDALFWDAWAVRLVMEAETTTSYNPIVHAKLAAEEDAIKAKARSLLLTRHAVYTCTPLDVLSCDTIVDMMHV